ncbi:MAG: hypothetical protein IJ608_03790 [Lachnospiraceae bacterium]|nr:hypothetical protein [Lachnospiraceae bacterium]
MRTKFIDVIAQHKQNGKVIPIKVRLRDEVGEIQDYRLAGYMDLTTYLENDRNDGRKHAQNGIYHFRCKVVSFGRDVYFNLYYGASQCGWWLLTDRDEQESAVT